MRDEPKLNQSRRAGSTKGEWYFVHALAGLTFVEIIFLVLAQMYLSQGHPMSLPGGLLVAVVIGGFALFWFWVRMITDFFRERPPRNQAAWGWALFLGVYLGALAYFLAVWRPRHRVDAS
jgi:Na+/melibiose symporter-like transporter